MNSGKAIGIGTTTKLIDLRGLFGASKSILTAKGTIFYCVSNADEEFKARHQAGKVAVQGFTWIDDKTRFKVTDGASGINYTLSDLRVSEHIPLVDSVGVLLGFGVVDQLTATEATIRVSHSLGANIHLTEGFEIYPDSFLEAGEQIEVPVSVDFLSLVGVASSDGVVFHTGELKKKSNSGVGSGGSPAPGGTYTNPNPTPTTIGGISAGSTFLNQTMQQMWDALLYPYQAPAFTSFSVSGAGTLEVGDTLPANQTASWGTSNSGNVNANSIDILNTTPIQSLVTGTANDGSEPLVQGSITKDSPDVNTWQIKGVNTQGGNFTRNYSKHWYFALYYGEDANAGHLVEADIEGLRVKMLASGFARNYSFNAGATYKYIAYPESFGTATSFTDTGSGFAVAMEAPYLVSVTNAFGVVENYRVHRTTNILNSAITIAVS